MLWEDEIVIFAVKEKDWKLTRFTSFLWRKLRNFKSSLLFNSLLDHREHHLNKFWRNAHIACHTADHVIEG